MSGLTPERWRRIDDLFAAALELSADERDAFLAGACGEDRDLRREVDSLLAHDRAEGTNGCLDRPASSEAAGLLVAGPGPLLAGQTLGPFTVIGSLGSGGMGEVYLAEDSRLHRRVAIKRLPAHLASDAERVRRFRHEALATSALNHPNIVTVHEIVPHPGGELLVTELVEGVTLRARARGGSMPPSTALDIALQVARGLAAAHAVGIVHRDVKPDNVMIRTDGLVKVLDFGVAKSLQAAVPEPTSQTGSGSVIGTVGYMSPEQACGRAVDARTDVWSLGVILYELVTGQSPFPGATAGARLAAILERDPPPPSELAAGLPPAFDRVVLRALSKDRGRRHADAAELAADLEQLRTWSGETMALPRQVDKERARRKAIGMAGALVAVVIGYAALERVVPWLRLPRPQAQQMQVSRFTVSGNVTTAAISPDGRYIATAQDEAGQQSLWLRQVAGNARAVPLQAAAPVEYLGVTFSRDGTFLYYVAWLRNASDAWLYELPILGGAPRRLESVDTPIGLSPTGDRFAYVTSSSSRGESYIKVADIGGGEPRALVRRATPQFVAAYPGGPAWSPDGRVVAYVAGGPGGNGARRMRLFVASVDGGDEHPLGVVSWREAGRVAWLQDGRALVVSARESVDAPRQLWLVTYPGGSTRRITNDLYDYDSATVTADGRRLAAVQAQETFTITVAPSAESQPGGGEATTPRAILSEVGGGQAALAFASSDRLVYTSRASGNWDLWSMSLDGSDAHQLTVDPHNDLFPAISADGRLIAFLSDRAGASNIWRMRMDGSHPVRLTSGVSQTHPDVTPDGQWVLYQQGIGLDEPRIWRVPASGGEARPLTMSTSLSPAVSPDGKTMAFVYMDGEGWGLATRALEGGGPTRKFPFPPTVRSRIFRFSPDGRALAYVVTEGGAPSLWLQPLDGDAPRRLMTLPAGDLVGFDWSPDGRWLAAVRTTVTSDVVLLSDFAR